MDSTEITLNIGGYMTIREYGEAYKGLRMSNSPDVSFREMVHIFWKLLKEELR